PSATTEAWRPTQAPPGLLQARQARFTTAIGRLKPGVTLQQAEADLDAVQARLGEQFPQTDRGWGASIVPIKEEQVGGVRRSLWFLLGAVTLVLFAACGNVACLLLADAARREHEFAVRFALGADRRRVVIQLITEGALLAMGGAAIGIAIARWGIDALRTAASQLPRAGEVRVDVRLIAFTFAIGIVTTVLFALVPALHASRRDAADALARGGRSQSGGRLLLQRWLVIAQIALASVLLVGAGLLVRSFAHIRQVAPGFDPDRVVTFRMSAQWSERTDAVVQRQARTLARLRSIPGVSNASFSQMLPAGITIPPGEFHIVGRDPAEKTFSLARSVGPGYFRTLHIPILQGADCADDPTAPQHLRALVTRSFADRFFPGADAVGHFVRSPGLPDVNTEIIGVVGDVRESGLLRAPEPLIYWCTYNGYWPDPFFLIRLDAARPASMIAVREAMHEIEPGRAVYAIRPLTDFLSESVSEQRVTTILLALFASTALLLAAMGLYGVLSQLVASRRREIGVRMALGARASQVLASIVGQAATVAGIGIVAGLAGSLALTRVMATLLFGIAPQDPVTFAAAPIVLAAVAMAAALIPARRAASIDPMQALRND
ncbi:MAG TPA: FtsX-like permease family protein, partial [Vicinamibacterales bacterium]|nr:FtsX-like permease family protein [Vicinamibacterales bacterium]